MNDTVAFITGGDMNAYEARVLAHSQQTVQEGAFVVVNNAAAEDEYFGLIADIKLGTTNPEFATNPITRLNALTQKCVKTHTLYKTVKILPALMKRKGVDKLFSVKRLPDHHDPIRMATKEDIALVFGDPDETNNFVIGHTREQWHPVCLNLEKLLQRSSGVFGATGSGKSFLVRMILAGLIKRGQAAVLVLDMHNGAPRST